LIDRGATLFIILIRRLVVEMFDYAQRFGTQLAVLNH
jgi:hypothetical protein